MLQTSTPLLFAIWRRVAALCMTIAACVSCTSLTFSEEGLLDFQKYSSVRVEMELLNAGADRVYVDYFVREMREVSGFETVTADEGQETDVILSVVVAVQYEQSNDDSGNLEYRAEANFIALTPDGDVLDRDSLTDESYSFDEAIEDALDEIAARYIRPYRF